MVDYTNISNVSVEPLAPVTSELMTSLRDNPIAIAEGSVGAPSMYVGLANRLQAGALGTWVFAYCTTNNVSYGSLVAGSTLSPTSGVSLFNQDSGAAGTVELAKGGPLTGTWMCLGMYTRTVSTASTENTIIQGATLWMRVV